MRTPRLLALALVPAPALAHPGHAAAVGSGLLHWLVEPDHIAFLALSAAVLAVPSVLRALLRLLGRG